MRSWRQHARPAGAQRRANRNFLLTTERFCQRQIGHVHTSNQKDECNRSEQHQQGSAHVAHHVVVQRQDCRAPSLIVIGIELLQAV